MRMSALSLAHQSLDERVTTYIVDISRRVTPMAICIRPHRRNMNPFSPQARDHAFFLEARLEMKTSHRGNFIRRDPQQWSLSNLLVL